ncbi:protein angel homolog 1 isoform X1 [Microcaecilia unicolor]|uniref:Protein angel homolog 1 n=2 Tax=Microcaecilia unicolor TaxID=1415580 RepID=A0A6P7Z543_9AMPH|nr:protein angel homolog 1 isoform X1 [Microcaecilia unicolor]
MAAPAEGVISVHEKTVPPERTPPSWGNGSSVMAGGTTVSPQPLNEEQKTLLQQWLGKRDSNRQNAPGDTWQQGKVLTLEGQEKSEVRGSGDKQDQHLDVMSAMVLEGKPADLAEGQDEMVALVNSGQFLYSTEVTLQTDHSVISCPAVPPAVDRECWEEDKAVLEWSLAPEGTLEEAPMSSGWQLQELEQSLPEAILYHEILWRDWEDLSLQSHCCPDGMQARDAGSGVQFEFTLMSYNILAQDLVEQSPELYVHCHPDILSWSYRFQNILQELQHWDPDILCLQEVQENHYWEQLEPTLGMMGFTCFYKRRTGRKTDGCAICYKHDRFSLLCANPVEFFRPGIDILNRDNVGLVLLLQPFVPATASGSTPTIMPLCVANTHLLYNPRRGDIKLAQLALLLAEIDKVARTAEGNCYPIILCGDLNSVPNSPLYNFIQNGTLCYLGMPAWKVSGQEDCSHQPFQSKLPVPLWPSFLRVTDSCQYVLQSESSNSDRQKYSRDFLLQFQFCESACQRPVDLLLLEGVTDAKPEPPEYWSQRVSRITTPDMGTSFLRSPGLIQHSLSLTSVYSHFLPGKGRAEVTTMPMGFGATVDYIFFSAEPLGDGRNGGQRLYRDGILKLLGRLSLLSEDDLWAAHGLPNPFCSSDHLCLLARFGMDMIIP